MEHRCIARGVGLVQAACGEQEGGGRVSGRLKVRLDRRGDVEAEARVRRGHLHSITCGARGGAATVGPGLRGRFAVPRDGAFVPRRCVGGVNRNQRGATDRVNRQRHFGSNDGKIARHTNMLHPHAKMTECLFAARHGRFNGLRGAKGTVLGNLRDRGVFHKWCREPKIGEHNGRCPVIVGCHSQVREDGVTLLPSTIHAVRVHGTSTPVDFGAVIKCHPKRKLNVTSSCTLCEGGCI